MSNKEAKLSHFAKLIQKARNAEREDSHRLKNAERYEVSVDTGLNAAQVAARVEDGLTNVKPINRSKSYARIFFENIFNFCNTATMALCIVLLAIGQGGEAVSSCIIFLNMAIGIFQEIKAKHTVEKLALVVDSTCDVLRDGAFKHISTKELVLDDVYKLTAGMQVPVDCEIMDGDVELDESILTGESAIVKKHLGDTALAASHVVGGEALAHAVRVGKDCYIEDVAKIARRVAKPKSNIFSNLDRIIKGISIALVPIAILLAISSVLAGSSADETILKVAGSVIGMLPVGMFLLTSTAMASSVIKLTKKNTLAQDLYGVEMLATVDTLLLDKTGTITSGEQEVAEEYYLNECDGAAVIATILAATKDQNPTAKALAKKYGDTALLEHGEALAFSSARKYSAVEIGDSVYCLGAPDFVATETLDVKSFSLLNSEQCRRSLLLTRCEGKIADINKDKAQPMMLISLTDSLRDDVKDTMKWFRENNVDVKIVSGDDPYTVSKIAQATGVHGSENYVNCSEVTDEELYSKLESNSIFGRVSPEQKCGIVKELQARGKCVGMIGDGVNDVQALKEADCSISFAGANEVARNISRIILLDNNFKILPEAVKEGRRVIGNVEKVSTLYIMKNLFVMVMSFIFAVIAFATKEVLYPFEPARMLLIEFCVIGVPTVAFALQSSKRQMSGHFLKNVLKASFCSGVSLLVGVGLILILMKTGVIQYSDKIFSLAKLGEMNAEGLLELPNKIYSTLPVLTFTFAGFSALFVVSMPPNKFRLLVVFGMFGVAIFLLWLENFLFPNGFFFNIFFIKDAVLIAWVLLGTAVATGVNLGMRALLGAIDKKYGTRIDAFTARVAAKFKKIGVKL